MAQIEDGKGRGFKAAVNSEQQLTVAAVTQGELEHESEENGQGYNWSTDLVNIDANDTVLLVKNTSDTPLHVECIKIANGSTASEFTVHLPTTEVTVTGTTVTGTNLNTAKTNVAEASVASDETNNSQGNVIGTVWLAVDASKDIETPGLILGKNKSVAVDVVEATTEVAATIIGHYAD